MDDGDRSEVDFGPDDRDTALQVLRGVGDDELLLGLYAALVFGHETIKVLD